MVRSRLDIVENTEIMVGPNQSFYCGTLRPDCRPFRTGIFIIGVFQTLIDNGATVIVIEHDLDVIRNADYVIDMGPGGGEAGGRIVASGTPDEIKSEKESITGRFL